MRIGLKGPFNAYTGYGNDLLGIAKALDDLGHDVVPVPRDVVPGFSQQVANLFTKTVTGKYDLLLFHDDPGHLVTSEGMRHKAEAIVGWSMWEKSRIDKGDVKGLGRKPLKYMDMLVAYDPVSAEAFEQYYKGLPVRVLQGGIDASRWQYVERDWSGTLRFCMLGQLHMRKDPFVAIDAFRELRDEGELKDAELHLKTNVPGLHPAIERLIPGVHVYCDSWPPSRVRQFIESNHVLLAPSKGEGKNLPALEMQLSGGVSVCTAWGGAQMWQHEDYSPKLRYDLVPTGPGLKSVHAAADKEHLKQIMLDLYENRAKTKRMGEVASQNIRMMCDWKVVVEKFLGLVKEAQDARG